jgi:hypothetical protein
MDQTKALLFLIFAVYINFSSLSAQTVSQTVIASDGGSGAGAGVRLDYTLGEMAVDGLTGQAISITEGFHQPFLRIENVDSSPSSQGTSITKESESIITLTPNPVKSELTVKFDPQAPESIALDVRDANGILVLQKQFDPLNGDTPLDVSGFLPGVYYFQFASPDQRIQSTFKISKIQ